MNIKAKIVTTLNENTSFFYFSLIWQQQASYFKVNLTRADHADRPFLYAFGEE